MTVITPTNFDEWFHKAIINGADARTLGFLKCFPHHFGTTDFEASAEKWDRVCNGLREKDYDPVEDLGEDVGAELKAFLTLHEVLSQTGDILAGKLTEWDAAGDGATAYSLGSAISYELSLRARRIKDTSDDKEERMKWMAEADNFVAFVTKNFPIDVAVLVIKESIATYRLPYELKSMKNFLEFERRCRPFIFGDD